MSRFWVFWIRKTIKKVTIVVPVLMTSCHVSENPKIGPVTAQITIEAQATANVEARPHCAEVHCAAVPKAAPTENGRDLEFQMAPPQRISLKAVRFVLAAQSDHVTFGIYAGPLPAAQLPFLFSRSTDD